MLIKPKAPVRIEGCRKRCLIVFITTTNPKEKKCCTLYQYTGSTNKSCASKAVGDKDVRGWSFVIAFPLECVSFCKETPHVMFN